MSLDKIETLLQNHVTDLETKGILKGNEHIVTEIKPAVNGFSERYILKGHNDHAFHKMNSNSYLGLSLHPQVIEAEEKAAQQYGAGPGAVRFISGTYQTHIDLEQKLAAFHGREAAMIMSAAYAAVVGVLPQFITKDTLVVSDALNHNCIINAVRLARPASKAVYVHLDMQDLRNILEKNKGKFKRVCVVTDGIFSMRGDHAPLDEIVDICKKHEADYEEGIISIVDDSHGVGAFGETGRGTEEYTNTNVDILIATLGKAIGVNGGYVVSNENVIKYLRETSPFYIYSNPITPAEAAAATKALQILDSKEGLKLLAHMRKLAVRLRKGLIELGFEIIEGDHPIVPMLIRDTQKTSSLVKYFFDNDVLVTGLNYPVVPKGEEEIRLQVSAIHTDKDIEYLLEILKSRVN
jgi:glycine C-acetyltransferase